VKRLWFSLYALIAVQAALTGVTARFLVDGYSPVRESAYAVVSAL